MTAILLIHLIRDHKSKRTPLLIDDSIFSWLILTAQMAAWQCYMWYPICVYIFMWGMCTAQFFPLLFEHQIEMKRMECWAGTVISNCVISHQMPCKEILIIYSYWSKTHLTSHWFMCPYPTWGTVKKDWHMILIFAIAGRPCVRSVIFLKQFYAV